MVAYTIVHENSEQGQSVIGQHIIKLPVNICKNFKLELSSISKSWGGGKISPNYLVLSTPMQPCWV